MLVVEFPVVHRSLSPVDKLRQRKLVTKIRAQFCRHIFTANFHTLDSTAYDDRYPLDTLHALQQSRPYHQESPAKLVASARPHPLLLDSALSNRNAPALHTNIVDRRSATLSSAQIS